MSDRLFTLAVHGVCYDGDCHDDLGPIPPDRENGRLSVIAQYGRGMTVKNGPPAGCGCLRAAELLRGEQLERISSLQSLPVCKGVRL